MCFTSVLLTKYLFQALVIYNFFHLLLAYLGGERELLILLHGRPPKDHLFPGRYSPFYLTLQLILSISLHLQARDGRLRSIHLSLAQARHTTCVTNYLLCATPELSVQVKPILAAVTLVLKATGNYGDGDFRSDKGYLYVTVVYNISICVALYSIAMFWVVINDDIKPFRPMPKFMCIKGT